MLTAIIQQNQNYYHGIGSTCYAAAKKFSPANLKFAKETTLGFIDFLNDNGLTERARLLREKNFPN